MKVFENNLKIIKFLFCLRKSCAVILIGTRMISYIISLLHYGSLPSLVLSSQTKIPYMHIVTEKIVISLQIEIRKEA